MTTGSRAPLAPSDRYVAGIGFASAASAAEIIALIEACLSELDLDSRQLAAIGTHMRKQSSPLLVSIAQHFGVPLRLLDDHDLTGDIPGIADAVAAVAGPLRLNKRKTSYATCAIALCARQFTIAGFGQSPSANISRAASTLLASSAGP